MIPISDPDKAIDSNNQKCNIRKSNDGIVKNDLKKLRVKSNAGNN